MDGCNRSIKKITSRIEWMAQDDPPQDASKLIKNEWPVATPLFK